MISKGSCDTEDWSNDAENYFYSYIHSSVIYFKIYSNIQVIQILNWNNIKQNIFYCIFYQINAALMSIKDLKDIKNICILFGMFAW